MSLPPLCVTRHQVNRLFLYCPQKVNWLESSQSANIWPQEYIVTAKTLPTPHAIGRRGYTFEGRIGLKRRIVYVKSPNPNPGPSLNYSEMFMAIFR